MLRRFVLVLSAVTAPTLVLVLACSSDRPPPLLDADSSVPQTDAHFYPPPIDAGSPYDEAGVSSARDYGGICDPAKSPVWHFFDFKTHTPGDSAIVFRARSAATEAALDQAPAVTLAVVTGPDNLVWTGVDVDPKLQSIGEKSYLWLRITMILVPGTQDAGSPVLIDYRQAYDCVAAQ
jgi:hypothetical protein